MSIIKPKNKRNERHFAIFAYFVGKLKFLVSKIYLQVFNIPLPTFGLTSAISRDSMLIFGDTNLISESG